MGLFLSTTLSIALSLFVIGAVVRAYIILPRRISTLEKRIGKLENKKEEK